MNIYYKFFIIIFFIISLILWQLWYTEHYQKQSLMNQINSEKTYKNSNENLNTILNISKNFTDKNNNIYSDKNLITVKTDVFLLKINMWGGDIEEALLINYLDNLDSKKPLHLLYISPENKYQVSSILINKDSPKDPINNRYHTERLFYTAINNNTNRNNEYILLDHENTLQVILSHKNKNGVIYTKSYLFNRNDYAVRIHYTINNEGIYPIHTKLIGNLIQSTHITKLTKKNENDILLPFYQEGAYSTDKKKYQKYNLKDMQHANLNINSIGGWIALLQKYFVIAWLPIIPINNQFFTTYIDDHNMSIGFQSNSIHIPVGQQYESQSILWIGPKIQEKMNTVDPNLNLVIDYGWLWFISQPLFKLLQFIYSYIGNWGTSIILITIIIRIIMYPLTKAQYTSIAKIRMLQPKLTVIQESYKHDKYQYHQKTIELYKKEKVNPLGGCLPLLIQMPIFLALYYMLSDSIELRHAKFIFWINDLSSQDPYYILPVIMGTTMFFIQKLSTTTISDPIQKKIMNITLIIFTIFFLWLPSGLVLYYIVSNILTIIQQQIIYQGLSKKRII